MDPLDQLDLLGPVLGAVVSGISADQLGRPTPCSQFTVREVLEHMVAGASSFAGVFRGGPPPPSSPETPGVLERFGPALADLGAAMHEPGSLDRPLSSPFGVVPGAELARFVVLDGLVHGWDLAVATGQDYAPPTPLVDEVRVFAEVALSGLRDGDTFAPAQPEPAGASPIEALAAFTGRVVPTVARA